MNKKKFKYIMQFMSTQSPIPNPQSPIPNPHVVKDIK